MSALVGSGGPWRWSSRAMLCVVAVPGRVVAPLPNGVGERQRAAHAPTAECGLRATRPGGASCASALCDRRP
jgi:hypothetical protein